MRLRGGLIAERVDKLPDLVALLLDAFFGFFYAFVVEAELFFRQVGLAKLALGLRQAIVPFFQLGIEFQGSFVVGGGAGEVSRFRVQYA